MDNLLDNPEIIQWCYGGITAISLKNTTNPNILENFKKEETDWGNKILRTTGHHQWTTMLCQRICAEALTRHGRSAVRKTSPKKSALTAKRYEPDLECDDYVYEVKGRSWCTTGTAGEKILGVPLKYGELPHLYNKPLQIILIGYQEYEARKGFAFGDLLNSQNQTKELQESLAFFKTRNIEYVGLTDILRKIGLHDNSFGE